jgi:hypothetical protein
MEERERCYSFILSRTPHETEDTREEKLLMDWIILYVRSKSFINEGQRKISVFMKVNKNSVVSRASNVGTVTQKIF